MIINESHIDLETPTGTMRTFLFRPTLGTEEGSDCKLGAIIVHSEIYQVTGPLMRFCRFIAAEGYFVAIGECYHELEVIVLSLRK